MGSTPFVHLLLFTYDSALLSSPMISLRQLYKLYCNPASKLQFSFCPGPVTQTDRTGIYGGLLQVSQGTVQQNLQQKQTDKLSNINKDTRNFPMGLSMKAGMVQNTNVINYVILY